MSHGAIANSVKLEVVMVEAEDLEKQGNADSLAGVDGILVPGGFGNRGITGKVMAVRYARENNIPFLGICLGMQCSVIEYARNVLGYDDADSTEFNNETAHPVIDLMYSQKYVTSKGGTMRLGAYPCVSQGRIQGFQGLRYCQHCRNCHRHRYEFNPTFAEELTKGGLLIAGTSPDGKLVEVVEIPSHRWFVACQFPSRNLSRRR